MVSPVAEGLRIQFDPGWLYVLAGGVVFAAVVLIPAIDDAHQAEAVALRARVWSDHQTTRVERYSEYLDALDRRDPTLIASLAASQLHLAPAGKRALLPADTSALADTDAIVFADIEPPAPVAPADYAPPDSILARLARGDRSRLVMLASAALCMLFGLFPPVSARDR